MGICKSCQNTAVSTAVLRKTTAKLVLEDGGVTEFGSPVKVSEILRQHRASGAFFVCDADGMGIEGFLRAMEREEELKPGQLYFLLPLSMLRRWLRPQDVADLACKASSALIKSLGVRPLVFPASGTGGSALKGKVAVQRSFNCRRVDRGGNRRYLNLELSAIVENEETEEGGIDD